MVYKSEEENSFATKSIRIDIFNLKPKLLSQM